MPHVRVARTKERITVSLSKDAATFLRKCRAKEDLPSLSALIERLIVDWKHRREMQDLAAKTIAYYDSLSAEERREQTAWAEFAESELTRPES